MLIFKYMDNVFCVHYYYESNSETEYEYALPHSQDPVRVPAIVPSESLPKANSG